MENETTYFKMPFNEKLCKFCENPIGHRVSFNANIDPTCWLYLEVGKSSHFECYIEKCFIEMGTGDQ